jgi:sulfonate transport system substrate-binding protein
MTSRIRPVCQRFRRLIVSGGLLVLCLLVILSGCSSSTKNDRDVVRIGYQKTGTLNLVRLRGTLVPELAGIGMSVEWIGFPAGPQLLEALNAGAIDFGHTGDTPPILAQAAGVPFVYVAHEPPRPHSEAILVPAGSALRTLADLQGKRVALNKGSNVHYLAVRALESARIPFDRVETVFLSPSDARAAFEGGSVDAWAVWDPYLAEAEIHAGARILADATGLVANREFQLASVKLAREHADAVRTIIAALEREAQWANGHMSEVASIFAAELGLEAKVLERVIGRKAFGISPMTDEVFAEQQHIADVFLGLHLIARPIVVRNLINPDLTEHASGIAHSTDAREIAAK